MSLEHKCLKQVQSQLEKYHTTLEYDLMGYDRLFISTSLTEKKRGRRAKKILASYCPFCGKKLKPRSVFGEMD